jgi:hypothetical protein
MSRIHLSLGYKTLSDTSQETVWENLFWKLSQDHKKNRESGIMYDYYIEDYVMDNSKAREP